jgi:hypothetical protein
VKVFCQIKTTKKEGSIITSFSYFFIGQQWRLINYLSNFEHVIGFNIIEFDFEVARHILSI